MFFFLPAVPATAVRALHFIARRLQDFIPSSFHVDVLHNISSLARNNIDVAYCTAYDCCDEAEISLVDITPYMASAATEVV